MKKFKTFIPVKAAAYCAVALLLATTSCKKDRNNDDDTSIIGPNVNVYALQQDNKIAGFNAQTGRINTQATTITGLSGAGETILAIDFRPATGQLYGVSSASRIYVIDPTTAVARAIGSTAFSPAINGTAVGFDFNPSVDRIRLITANGQNLRLNPETGAVQMEDGAINGAAGAKIASSAYTDNKAGTTTTNLFNIDAVTRKLYRQEPPNNGTQVAIGDLGIEATEVNDFDISPSGAALAPITVGGKQSLYVIDLSNGKAYRSLSFTTKVISLAIVTDPVAYAIGATANDLLIFNPSSPAPVAKTINGLQSGETILGIDFRPLNGQLYALGSTSRIYTLNASSGLATQVGTGTLTTALSGASFGFDFNPLADRIRIVSNTGQNLRVNPNDGTVTPDGNITPAANLALSATAYSNNFVGATNGTTMYAINAQTGRLYSLNDPNSGVLANDIGSLGITIDAANGFDIGRDNNAYALLTVGTATRFYGINLTTGLATAGSNFPQTVRGFALGLGF